MRADANGLRRRFVLLTGLRWLPVGFTAPLLVLLPLSRGLTLGQVGLTIACYATTTAVLELPTGGLADAVGRRPVLGASAFLGLLVLASMLVAEDLGPWIALRVLSGAARALDSGPLEAWYIDEVRDLDAGADIRTGLARAQAAEGGGLALSAVAGGLLPAVLGGNLNAAVLAALVAQALYLACVLALMTDHRKGKGDRRTAEAASATRRVTTVLRSGFALGTARGPVTWLLCGSAVTGTVLAGLELLGPPRFTDLLGSRSETGPLGFLLAGGFLAAAAGSAMAPRLGRLAGGSTSRSALACTAAQAVVYLVLAAAGSVAMAAPAFIAVYLMGGARGPFHNELLHEHVGSEQRSTMLSAASLSLMAGGLVSSLTLPTLVEMAGIPWTWALVGSVLAGSSLLYLAIPDHPTPVVPPSDHEPEHDIAPFAVT